MRIIELSPNERVDICGKCNTTFAYTKEDTSVYYTEWQDTDPRGEHPYHEIRFKRRYVVCPNCGKDNHLHASSQMRRKGSREYDD